ncbi:MAG: HDOD domain-containing protein [Gammaproteobacteria bacterium]
MMSLTVSALYRNSGKTWMRDKLLSAWNDSIKIAALSEVIARRYPNLEQSEALLIGLIHNIGIVPIVHLCGSKYGKPEHPEILDDAILKLTPTLSKWILEKWQLNRRLTPVPELIADLKRTHDGPPDYADIVQVARLHVYRNKQHPLGQVPWAQVPAFDKLQLTPEKSIQIIKEARDEIKEVISLFQ